MLGDYEPAAFLKKRYSLSGWKAEAVDWGVGFAEAAIFYFIILPLVLGAYPPAVVVQSCSMAGTYNVGDIAVMVGAPFGSIRAPLVNASSLNYSIYPNNISEQTQELIFPGGQKVPVTKKGDIILHISPINGEQIIHRAIAKVITPQGRFIITKGDANPIPDSAKIECAEWVQESGGMRCTKIRSTVSHICTSADKGYPGCLSTPVPEGKVLGKAAFTIPLLGHVKMLFMHIITLGHGYPGPMWC